MPKPTNEKTPVGVAVQHPDWCDATACTATPQAATGEAHQGAPATVSVWGIYGTLEITAYLSQAHCRWPTDVYVDLDIHGLTHDYQLTGGRAAFPVAKLTEIARMLTDLATTGNAWQDQQTAQELNATYRKVQADQAGDAR